MNVKLKDITYTSKDGDNFWKIKEGFIRGNNIKSIQFKENLIEKLEEQKEKMMNIPGIDIY
jgi:U6 snRNA-associated Sm-like protein LSm4